MVDSNRLFHKEFKNMMLSRRSDNKLIDVNRLPIPPLEGICKAPTLKKVEIKGVSEEFFDKLNGTECFLVGKQKLQQRIALSDGSFRMDSNGKYVYKDISVKNSSVAILSLDNIALKNYKIVGNSKVKHNISEGFMYIDYTDKGGKRYYIYVIPREYVYTLNLSALVLSKNTLKSHYGGYRLAIQNGEYLNIYVIPYKYRQNEGNRIIGVKKGINYSNELKTILNYWLSKGYTFDTRYTYVKDDKGLLRNPSFERRVGTLTEYKPIGSNLVMTNTIEGMVE